MVADSGLQVQCRGTREGEGREATGVGRKVSAVSRTKLLVISLSRVSHALVSVQLCCPASGDVNNTRNHYLSITYIILYYIICRVLHALTMDIYYKYYIQNLDGDHIHVVC